MIYANEWDKDAAYWLSCLPLQFDEIDTRSIEFVQGSELVDYDQCHFFAGIGGWPLALEIAGWPDDAPVWTGSCPCQPFSQAGKRKGTADERHLWPEFRRLIDECRPATIFGEQVASKDGRNWLATVRTDLEALGYAVGAADLCAASVGAPHIRQRLFWVAHRSGERLEGWPEQLARNEQQTTERSGDADWVADSSGSSRVQHEREQGRWEQATENTSVDQRNSFGLANTRRDRSDTRSGSTNRMETQERSQQVVNDQPSCGLGNTKSIRGRRRIRCEQRESGRDGSSLPSRSSHWHDIEFIPCRDGKARPVKSGVRLLAHGIPGRVAQLRGLGNAIVPQVAAEFVSSFMEVVGMTPNPPEPQT